MAILKASMYMKVGLYFQKPGLKFFLKVNIKHIKNFCLKLGPSMETCKILGTKSSFKPNIKIFRNGMN